MKTTIKILLLTLSVCIHSLQAQQVSYSVEKNNSNAEDLFINLRLLDIDLGFPILSLGGGVEADYFLNEKLSFEGSLRFSYYDMKRGLIKATVDVENTNKLNRFFEARIGGRYHLSDKQGSTKMRAIVSSETIGNTVRTTFIPMDVPCRKIVAMHYGIQYYTSAIKGRRGPSIPGQLSVGPSVTATDGTTFSEWGSATNLNVFMVYGGFSFIKIMQTTMTSNSGTWHFNLFKNSYVDVLFAPLINVQNINYKNVEYNVQGSGSAGFNKNPFGIRYGISAMGKKRMSFSYEIGWLPGLQVGLFTRASFGIPISMGTKKSTKS